MGSQNDLPSQNHMRTGRWHLHATPHATSMKEWSALTHLGLLFGAGSIAFLMLQREVEILLTCPPPKKRQASLLLKGWEENFSLDFNWKPGGWQLFNGRQKGSFPISLRHPLTLQVHGLYCAMAMCQVPDGHEHFAFPHSDATGLCQSTSELWCLLLPLPTPAPWSPGTR